MPSPSTVVANHGSHGSQGTRICSLGPNRVIIEELTPALMRCLPGAVVQDIRGYPSGAALESELQGNSPDLCFLDLVSDRQRALEIIPEFLRISPATQIIVLLAGNEPDLILKSLRLGASEFLLQPFTAEQLDASLAKLLKRDGIRGGGPGAGRVYCVTPVKGACGASVIATNLAYLWRAMPGRRVLLADLDPLTGTISFLMRLKSAYTFVDVLSRSESLDADLWNAMVVNVKGLDVLLAPESLLDGISEVRNATRIVDYARRAYDLAVLDTASAYGEWNLSIARASDEVLLVTTNELPALLSAQRVLAYLIDREVPRAKVRVVLNRYDPEIGLGREVVASALHVDVIEVIPSDYASVQQALIDTKPIPSSSAVGKSIAALAASLSGPASQTPSTTATRGLRSLFSRLS